jgi:hypothetical protein
METLRVSQGAHRLLAKPILGGAFGTAGEYALATRALVVRGLHKLEYMVLSPRAGTVLSLADDAHTALDEARRVLAAANDGSAHAARAHVQRELWPDEVATEQLRLRHVSRRRQEVWQRGGGNCFYCGCQLDFRGKWHVEHQMPRALGGDDRAINLVPACVRCNLTKRDRSAIEFLADRRGPA